MINLIILNNNKENQYRMEESVCLKRNLNEAKVQATMLKDKLSI